MITVEYLLPFNTQDGICKNIDSFKSLLSSNSNFRLDEDSIIYKLTKYSFKVTSTEVPNKDCSVFHVIFGVTKLTDKFREMLKLFKKTVGVNLKDNIQIVWDGVSFEWSKELYPRIYQVENSLRKLISKFMLTKLGIGWHNSTVPKDVTESIKEKSFKPSHSILYEVDFIQLANFLFKPYSIKDPNKLPEILNGIIESGMTMEKKNEILEYIPKNNWDRYFSEVVACESEQLKKNWTNLYEIRCKVAHNRPMIHEDFTQANEICKSLEKTFEKATSSIDKIEIPEEDKEKISLKTIGTINDSTKSFVDNYINLTNNLSSVAAQHTEKFSFISDYNNPIQSILDSSYSGKINLSSFVQNDLSSINSYKDMLLSGNTYLDNYMSIVNEGVFKVPKENLYEFVLAKEKNYHKILAEATKASDAVVKSFEVSDAIAKSIKARDSIIKSIRLKDAIAESIEVSKTVATSIEVSDRVAKSINAKDSVAKSNKVKDAVAKSIEPGSAIANSIKGNDAVAKSIELPSEVQFSPSKNDEKN